MGEVFLQITYVMQRVDISLSCLSECYGAAATVKNLRADRFLNTSHSDAQRGLTHVQVFCRDRKTSVLIYLIDILHVLFHKRLHIICQIYRALKYMKLII